MAATILAMASVGEIESTASGAGLNAWTGEGTATVAVGGGAAVCTLSLPGTGSETTNRLNIAFDSNSTPVPGEATILGIEMDLRVSQDAALAFVAAPTIELITDTTDSSGTQDVIGNQTGGITLGQMASATSLTTFTVGGPTDTWGADLTPAIINGFPDFGVSLIFTATSELGAEDVDITVDYAAIRVYYCIGNDCIESDREVTIDAESSPQAEAFGNMVVKPNSDFTYLSFTTEISGHTSTEWQFRPTTSTTATLEFTTNSGGVVSERTEGRILSAGLTDISIALDRSTDWYVRYRENGQSYSDWQLIDLGAEMRIIGGRHRDQYTETRTARGIQINHSNPKYQVRRTARGVQIIPQSYSSRGARKNFDRE